MSSTPECIRGGFKLQEYNLKSIADAFLQLDASAPLFLYSDTFNGTEKIATPSLKLIERLVIAKITALRSIASINEASSKIHVTNHRNLVVTAHLNAYQGADMPVSLIRVMAAVPPPAPHNAPPAT